MENELAKKQYADSRNLSTRINLHAKYSVNKQGFGNCLLDYSNHFFCVVYHNKLLQTVEISGAADQ